MRNAYRFLQLLWGGVLIFVFVTPVIWASTVEDPFEPLLLDVVINRKDIPNLAYCYRDTKSKDKPLYIVESDLVLWGLHPPSHAPLLYKHKRYYNLFWYKGLRYKVDEAALKLTVNVPANWLPPTVIEEGEGQLIKKRIRPKKTGLIVNYDINLSRVSHENKTYAAGLLKFKLFNPRGLWTTDLLAASEKGTRESKFVRLETNWTLDKPEKMVSWRVGDSITAVSDWSAAVRFAGIQYTTNFDMQPNFVTFPQPSFRGEVALPSTVDLFVDNVRREHRSIGSGPFFINSVPVVSGNGIIRVVTKDVLGREQVTILPYYSSRELLKVGLSDYSFELGVVRKNFTLKSFDYGRLIGVGTYSRGITTHFTLDSHLELSSAQQVLGFTHHYLVPHLGIFTVALAGSHNHNWGALFKAGFHRDGDSVSFGGRATVTTSTFTHIGLESGDREPRLLAQAFIGLSGSKWGSASFSYTKVDHRPSLSETSTEQLFPVELLTANYNKSLSKHLSLSLNSLFDLRNQQNNRYFASLVVALDTHHTVSVSSTYERHQVHGVVDFNKSAPVGIGWGYRLLGAVNASSTLEAGAVWHSRIGTYSADYSLIEKNSSYRLGGAGSIIYFDGHTMLSRPCHSSFALVEVSGFPGVRVYEHNQLMGRTNSKGYLLLPEALPYQDNEVHIDPHDLPLTATVGQTRMHRMPYRGSGTLVKFKVKNSQPIALKLKLPTNKYVPTGASVHVDKGSAEDFVVGYDGEVYLTIDSLHTHHLAGEAEWENIRCRFGADLPKKKSEIIELGELLCKPTA